MSEQPSGRLLVLRLAIFERRQRYRSQTFGLSMPVCYNHAVLTSSWKCGLSTSDVVNLAQSDSARAA